MASEQSSASLAWRISPHEPWQLGKTCLDLLWLFISTFSNWAVSCVYLPLNSKWLSKILCHTSGHKAQLWWAASLLEEALGSDWLQRGIINIMMWQQNGKMGEQARKCLILPNWSGMGMGGRLRKDYSEIDTWEGSGKNSPQEKNINKIKIE